MAKYSEKSEKNQNFDLFQQNLDSRWRESASDVSRTSVARRDLPVSARNQGIPRYARDTSLVRNGVSRQRLDRTPRQEWIECGLKIGTSQVLVAKQQVAVVDQAALVRGEQDGFAYVASIRGKTAVLKLSDSVSGVSTDLRGKIELLRGGGRSPRPAAAFVAAAEPARGGDDDNTDGQPENEGTIYATLKSPSRDSVTLVCSSINQRI
jgi:hypothetical protein